MFRAPVVKPRQKKNMTVNCCNDMTEILLKAAYNTIQLIIQYKQTTKKNVTLRLKFDLRRV